MSLHVLERRQLLKSDIDAVWKFICSPHNLQKITPDYMGFKVVTRLEEVEMYQGLIIEYYVKPVLGIPLHWVTEITHVKDREFFVDEQRKGPYAFWHHKHFIKACPDGVEMYDLVHYRLPFGIIGKLANLLFVKKQLEQVFDFRNKKLNELFNT